MFSKFGALFVLSARFLVGRKYGLFARLWQESRMHRFTPLTSGLKEPAESWISGRKRSLRYDVRLTSPWTIDGVLHLGNPVTPGPRTKALRVVAWSSAPRLSSHVDSSSTSTSLLNLRKNTARHGRPLTIPARHQGLGARHGDIIGLGRRHQLHILL